MQRYVLAAAAAAAIAFGVGRASAVPELVPTIPIPGYGYDGEGREVLCRVETLDPGKVKYDFGSESFYVQDFDGCFYRLHVDHGHVGLPHD